MGIGKNTLDIGLTGLLAIAWGTAKIINRTVEETRHLSFHLSKTPHQRIIGDPEKISTYYVRTTSEEQKRNASIDIRYDLGCSEPPTYSNYST